MPAEVIKAAANDRALAVATPLPVGREASEAARVLLDARGIRSGSLGDAAADADLVDLARDALRAGVSRTIRIGTRDLYVDVVAAARLVIVGAGEIAVYLVRLAHAIGFHTVVVDARTAFLTRERFPDADKLLVGWADELADRAGIDAGAHVVALAHDPKFDDPAITTALRRGARYVGARGRRRARAARPARCRRPTWPVSTPRSGLTSGATRRPTSRSGSWPRSCRNGTPGVGAPDALTRVWSACSNTCCTNSG